MHLILTHENSDFDAVASQLAAHKLYPEAIPLLSRHVNRNVRQFLTLHWDALPFMRAKDWRRQRVDELLLVDTHTFNSVRGLSRNPDVTVIDHHVDFEPNEGWHYQVEAVGATTTILTEMLQAAGLILAAEEATLLLLGIYEDTGTLTYDTTTPRDVRAAAWLLDQSAQLEVVRRFMQIPLTEAQQALYDELQSAIEWVEIRGQSLAITAVAAPEDFDDELSSIAHRLRETLNPSALFMLVQLHHDVQLVARSTTDQVDVSGIAGMLGGGGHSRAAAALILDRPLEKVKQELMDYLSQTVQPMAKVAEIMSYGVQTIAADTSVREAADMMRRLGHEGYPVIDPEQKKLVGLLTRRAVDRATSHDLERLPVRRIMKAGAFSVTPTDSIERVQQLMLREGWGQIPVVANSGGESWQPIGIVTRTDVLNFLFRSVSETAEPELRDRLKRFLSPAVWRMVCTVGKAATDLGMPLYFVGGLVRDMLLGLAAKDIDMVVEGNAIKLVNRLQKQYGGEVHTHARFGTAKWFTDEKVWRAVVGEDVSLNNVQPSIDFVTARSEFYKEPSALPEVERGSIKLDLHRRDFTINTLAVRLDGAYLGQLLDFYGGRRDLNEGLIRVLHSLSFVDDPTRILRAARLEQRLDFQIEARTAELIQSSLAMLDRVTGDRIRNEIELALREQSPIPVMARLDEIGVMAQLHPALTWTEETAVSFNRVPSLLEDDTWREALYGESPAFVYFSLWLLPLAAGVRHTVMERLHVRKATRQDLEASARLLQVVHNLPDDPKPSEVEQALRPFVPRVLLVVRAALGEPARIEMIKRYYKEWRHVQTELSGDTLRDMGLKPGPHYAMLLDWLLAARLDGKVNTAAEERALLEQMVADRAWEEQA